MRSWPMGEARLGRAPPPGSEQGHSRSRPNTGSRRSRSRLPGDCGRDAAGAGAVPGRARSTPRGDCGRDAANPAGPGSRRSRSRLAGDRGRDIAGTGAVPGRARSTPRGDRGRDAADPVDAVPGQSRSRRGSDHGRDSASAHAEVAEPGSGAVAEAGSGDAAAPGSAVVRQGPCHRCQSATTWCRSGMPRWDVVDGQTVCRKCYKAIKSG